MLKLVSKNESRLKVHRRIRRRVAGRADMPRLNVFRSLGHIYAQIIDDSQAQTLASASSVDKEIRKTLKSGGNVAAAKEVGSLIASRAKEKGIAAVVFDRGGFQYHGRIRALADAAREAGLKF